ncbi:MAG: hypothetical protein RBT52_02765 [Sulfurimonas sp.]|nr:hypothetical protein [Sulfurimonas sp.]
MPNILSAWWYDTRHSFYARGEDKSSLPFFYSLGNEVLTSSCCEWQG